MRRRLQDVEADREVIRQYILNHPELSGYRVLKFIRVANKGKVRIGAQAFWRVYKECRILDEYHV